MFHLECRYLPCIQLLIQRINERIHQRIMRLIPSLTMR